MEKPADRSPGQSQDGPHAKQATDYLRALSSGDSTAHDQLLSLVYAELRRKAAAYLAGEHPGHTLQPTALVHEAWFRLIDQEKVDWKGEGHFMAVAAQAMRRILVDHARRKKSAKRGGGHQRVDLESNIAEIRGAESDLVAIDQGLEELRGHSDRMAKIVELRFFAGFQEKAIAKMLGISKSTLDREWRVARAWLQSYVRRSQEQQ